MPAWFTVGAFVVLGLLAAALETASEVAAGIWATVMFAPVFWWMGQETYGNVRDAWRGEVTRNSGAQQHFERCQRLGEIPPARDPGKPSA